MAKFHAGCLNVISRVNLGMRKRSLDLASPPVAAIVPKSSSFVLNFKMVEVVLQGKPLDRCNCGR